MSAAPSDPYAELTAQLEQQLELAQAGELAALANLEAAWKRLREALPDDPPPTAAATLKRAALILEQTKGRLETLQRRLNAEARRQSVARRFGGSLAGDDHRPRVDRHA